MTGTPERETLPEGTKNPRWLQDVAAGMAEMPWDPREGPGHLTPGAAAGLLWALAGPLPEGFPRPDRVRLDRQGTVTARWTRSQVRMEVSCGPDGEVSCSFSSPGASYDGPPGPGGAQLGRYARMMPEAEPEEPPDQDEKPRARPDSLYIETGRASIGRSLKLSEHVSLDVDRDNVVLGIDIVALRKTGDWHTIPRQDGVLLRLVEPDRPDPVQEELDTFRDRARRARGMVLNDPEALAMLGRMAERGQLGMEDCGQSPASLGRLAAAGMCEIPEGLRGSNGSVIITPEGREMARMHMPAAENTQTGQTGK